MSIILWKISATAYNAISIRQEIESIWESIEEVYSDISKAHVNSALQAIAAAEYSKFYEHEMLDAISHLRDAYNVCESILYKRRTILFFFDKYLISKDDDRNKYLMYLAHLAGIISILYKSLNEPQTAVEWKSMAVKKFELGFDISARELYEIDKRFAKEDITEISYSSGRSIGSYSSGGSSGSSLHITYEKTPEGKEYIQTQKPIKAKEFGESIDQRRLDLKSLVKS